MDKKLFRFGIDCYEWIVAENIEQAVMFYKEIIGEKCFEINLSEWLNDNPGLSEDDFITEFVTIEENEKEMTWHDEDNKTSFTKTVEEFLKDFTVIPCYAGCSEC